MKVRIDEIKVNLRRRKDIYEMLYPETRAGTAQAMGMNKAKEEQRGLQFAIQEEVLHRGYCQRDRLPPQHYRTAHQNRNRSDAGGEGYLAGRRETRIQHNPEENIQAGPRPAEGGICPAGIGGNPNGGRISGKGAAAGIRVCDKRAFVKGIFTPKVKVPEKLIVIKNSTILNSLPPMEAIPSDSIAPKQPHKHTIAYSKFHHPGCPSKDG